MGMIGQAIDAAEHEKGNYTLIRDPEDFQTGLYDKPLPCYGCGIGWFSFLLGFLCPPLWYYATMLYFGNYYKKDPRERAGLGASAIAALICSVALLIVGTILLLRFP
ncbi:60S ribosomal protein L18a-like protein isoform X5 [Cajanus cajan]|uniref:60S ribosomal protein L18a-like protein isoform X5 n=1 Tax=Cajanus cajan TaxID=3821 RepID=UPI0010FAE9BB|nr:60S ribosomal protein L18a-like protein isoform X5 [Cajanus cajan]